MAAPCPPTTFDFYRCAISDLLDFTVDIDFVATRTAIMHGLASWFDLDFEPADNGQQDEDTEEDLVEAEAWNFSVSNAAWPWLSADPPLNPGPTPEPPRKGLKVTLSTGPNGACGVRLCG